MILSLNFVFLTVTWLPAACAHVNSHTNMEILSFTLLGVYVGTEVVRPAEGGFIGFDGTPTRNILNETLCTTFSTTVLHRISITTDTPPTPLPPLTIQCATPGRHHFVQTVSLHRRCCYYYLPPLFLTGPQKSIHRTRLICICMCFIHRYMFVFYIYIPIPLLCVNPYKNTCSVYQGCTGLVGRWANAHWTAPHI